MVWLEGVNKVGMLLQGVNERVDDGVKYHH